MKKASVKITPSEMHSQVQSWNLPPDGEAHEYTSNHLIHAYTKGVSDGMEQNEKLFRKQFEDNSKAAATDTSKVIEKLKSIGVAPISAHLRIDTLYALDVLITVSNEDFIKESFSAAYACVNEIQESSKSDLYSITFTFINKSSSFDLELLKSDGYLSSFKPLEEK